MSKHYYIYNNTLWPSGEGLMTCGIVTRESVDQTVRQFGKTFRATYLYHFADNFKIETQEQAKMLTDVITQAALAEATIDYHDFVCEFEDALVSCDEFRNYRMGSESVIPGTVYAALTLDHDLSGKDLYHFLMGLTIRNSALRVCEAALAEGEEESIRTLVSAVDKELSTYDLINVVKRYAKDCS